MLHPSATLAPGLLLAAPALTDPNFTRAVVLLGHHDEDGALGWVLNGRSVGSARRVLQQAELVPGDVSLPRIGAYARDVRLGGPVEAGTAWLVYRKRAGAPVFEGELDLGDDLVLTGARDVVESVARAEGPSDFRLVLGYSGWGAGQLEREIASGDWLPAPLDSNLLLDADPDAIWDLAWRSTGVGHALTFGGTHKGSS